MTLKAYGRICSGKRKGERIEVVVHTKTLDSIRACKMMIATCAGLRLTSWEPVKVPEDALAPIMINCGYS